MNGCEPNRNEIQMQNNDCDNENNENLVLKCEQLLEYVNQPDSEGEDDFQLFLIFMINKFWQLVKNKYLFKFD